MKICKHYYFDENGYCLQCRMRHWGYGYGNKNNNYGQTAISAKGGTLTLESLQKTYQLAEKHGMNVKTTPRKKVIKMIRENK